MFSGATRMKAMLAVALATLLGVGLAGCGSKTKEPTTITMAAGSIGKEFEVLKEQVAAFEVQHPHIHVELIEMPESTTDRHAAYVARLEREDPTIDIYMIDIIWLPEFGAQGWTIPLDDYVVAKGIDMADFLPGIVQVNTWNGKLVAMPWFTSVGLLYYRQDLLDQYGFDVPQTWAELVDISATIVEGEKERSPEIVGFVFQGRQYEGLVCNYLEYVWGNGAAVFSERGDHVVLNSPQAVEALKVFTGMQAIAPAGVTSFQEEDALNYFRSGNAIFMRSWPYAWSVLNSEPTCSAGEDLPSLKGKVGIAALPHGPSGSESASTLGGWQLGISAYSQHPDEAFEFIAFLTASDQQIFKAIQAGQSPTRQAAYQDAEALEANPHMAQLFDVFMNARPRPVHPHYPEISAIIQRQVHSVLTGQQDAATATEIIALEIEKMIQEVTP